LYCSLSFAGSKEVGSPKNLKRKTKTSDPISITVHEGLHSEGAKGKWSYAITKSGVTDLNGDAPHSADAAFTLVSNKKINIETENIPLSALTYSERTIHLNYKGIRREFKDIEDTDVEFAAAILIRIRGGSEYAYIQWAGATNKECGESYHTLIEVSGYFKNPHTHGRACDI
jgi:hypothetical protein